MILTLTINHRKCILVHTHCFLFPSVSGRSIIHPPFILVLLSRSLPLALTLFLLNFKYSVCWLLPVRIYTFRSLPFPFFNSLQLFSSITPFKNLFFLRADVSDLYFLFIYFYCLCYCRCPIFPPSPSLTPTSLVYPHTMSLSMGPSCMFID